MTTTTGKPGFLIKPTLETKFHIDYSWWEKSSEDLRTYLTQPSAAGTARAIEPNG